MKLMKFLAVSLVITTLVPFGLIASQWPMKMKDVQSGETLNLEEVVLKAVAIKCMYARTCTAAVVE